jgi:hypothetical protein
MDNGEKTNLEEAFSLLQLQPNGESNLRKGSLIDNARKAYLDYLNQLDDHPPFQLRIYGNETYLSTTIHKEGSTLFHSLLTYQLNLE